MQKDILLPSGLAALVCAVSCPTVSLCAVPCPASPDAVSLTSTTTAVPTGTPAALVWHMAGPSRERPAAVRLGETQKILGRATGKVKQTIYFQAEQSDVDVSV